MQAVVKAAGLDLSHVVFVNPYLTSEIPTHVMNERYARRFEFGNTPARATIEVSSLPGGAHLKLDLILAKENMVQTILSKILKENFKGIAPLLLQDYALTWNGSSKKFKVEFLEQQDH